ncbi:MAG: M28 family peptidase, partial [Desulfomonilaceae bacterium]
HYYTSRRARIAGGGALPQSFARHLIRTAKQEALNDWLDILPSRASTRPEGENVQNALRSVLNPDGPLPAAMTFETTATRDYEEAYWNDILTLSHGVYRNKDNADVVQDPPTLHHVSHNRRDLKRLGDYLIERHRQAIASSGMAGKAVVGDLPFRWQTDFDFPLFGGWKVNQEEAEQERDILVVIQGKNRNEAVVLADHYDTAYMKDVYYKAKGGSGARLASAGADDDHSATATLLQAAPIFLRLSREGKLERDIWLLHLTGEEFPADSLGARHFSRSLVERTLKLHADNGRIIDLSSVHVSGIFVMDMIAHNRQNGQDIFRISPGKSHESFRMAYQAHISNMIWNSKVEEWNHGPQRRGRERAKRCKDDVTIPEIARHLELDGQVRTFYDPQSSLYNTDGQISSDTGLPVVLCMENYDINRTGYHDTKDTMENIDLGYGAALSPIVIETVARVATLTRV